MRKGSHTELQRYNNGVSSRRFKNKRVTVVETKEKTFVIEIRNFRKDGGNSSEYGREKGTDFLNIHLSAETLSEIMLLIIAAQSEKIFTQTLIK